MGKLWNQTTGTNYIDMSVVFTMNGGDGWIQLLDTLHRIEKTCIRGDPSPSADCLKWKREKRRRNLKITEQIYDTAADRPVEGEEREEGTSKGHDSIYGKGLRPRSTGVTTEKDNVDGAFVHHTHERSLNDEQSHRRRKEKKYEDNNDKYNENADDNENDDDNDNPGYRVYFGDIIHTLYGRNRNRNRHLI